ncbi:hypothetical protein [Litoribacterium kuwaitense]|uniref:hypothetical protein n=1 Tax=Litoribacterium kuwaitense TaxID=1398745 RepID=UPI001FEA615D|nr:hypothetical protein [Litoribacterium kuwaitense]
MNNLERKLESALKEITRLKDENQKLKELLAKHKIPVSNNQDKHIQPMARSEILQKRITIFRSLFKGRTDVYAVHWGRMESQTMHRHVFMNPENYIKSVSCCH